MAGRFSARLILAAAVFALGACATVSRETVTVPVIVAPTPPPELLAPLTAPLPRFVLPEDPDAASALTPEGERHLRRLLLDLFARVQAWEAWSLPDGGARGR